ncbi:MAG: sigma-70 family RNA polymerase sigma factor [Myxococcales bacterium]|nr:MAG: sigma-70 family RNA polymerase sigma factor [Myxococcales bacterium]
MQRGEAMKIQHDNNTAARADDPRVARAWSDDREQDTKPSAASERGNESIDVLSVYMSQIGEVALLTRQQEIDLAIEIQQARAEVRNAAFQLPFAVRYVEELAARLEDGEGAMREIVAYARADDEVSLEERARTFLAGVTRLKRTSRVATVGTKRERAAAKIVEQMHRLELGEKTVTAMIAKLEEAVRLIAGQERTIKRVERRAGMTAEEILVAGRKRGASQEVGRWSAEVAEARAVIEDLLETLGTSREAVREAMRTIRRHSAVADAARDRFTRANLRLVVMIAKRYSNRGLPLSDLIQEGNIGLMYAVDRFDHRVGCKFSTYAVHWIKQAIARLLQKQTRAVSVPSYLREVVSKVHRSARELRADLNREPSIDEIAELAQVPPAKVIDVLDLNVPAVSLDEPLGEAYDRSLHDVIEDFKTPAPGEAADMDLYFRVERIIDSLRERESEVLRMRFGLGTETDYALDEVGARFGVSRERARQIESQALRRLRARR